MRILKNNLEELSKGIGGQTSNSININFPQLPNDNRIRLIPKESEDEKQIMYKEGDKMRIPGVLDYTGAKYPFKKVKKGQEGLDTNIFNWNDPRIKYGPLGPSYYDYPQVNFNQYLNPESGYYPNFGELSNEEIKNAQKRGLGKKIYIDENGEFTIESQKRENTKESTNLGNYFRKQLLYNENALTSLYEILNPSPIYKGKGIGRRNDKDTIENRLKKLKMLFEWSGNPTFDTKDNTPHYFNMISGDRAHIAPGKKTYLRGDSYSLMSALIDELSHHYQVNNPISKKFDLDSSLVGLVGGDIRDLNSENGYERYGGNEFNAHEIIQKAMYDFVFNTKYKTEIDFVKLLGKYKVDATKKYFSSDNVKNRKQKRSDNFRKIINPGYDALTKSMYSGGLLIAKSGIKIKKKNRGKFTNYCGGNVTQECINRAKKSGNKTLIKRATFADNARHFKHRSGGQIIQEFKLKKC